MRCNDCDGDTTCGATTVTMTPMPHKDSDCDTTCGVMTATATPHVAQRRQPRHPHCATMAPGNTTRGATTMTATPHAAWQPRPRHHPCSQDRLRAPQSPHFCKHLLSTLQCPRSSLLHPHNFPTNYIT